MSALYASHEYGDEDVYYVYEDEVYQEETAIACPHCAEIVLSHWWYCPYCSQGLRSLSEFLDGKSCFNCGLSVEPNWHFCAFCSVSLDGCGMEADHLHDEGGICPHCERSVGSDWKVCRFCMTELKKEHEKIFCSHCEKLVDSVRMICPHCSGELRVSNDDGN